MIKIEAAQRLEEEAFLGDLANHVVTGIKHFYGKAKAHANHGRAMQQANNFSQHLGVLSAATNKNHLERHAAWKAELKKQGFKISHSHKGKRVTSFTVHHPSHPHTQFKFRVAHTKNGYTISHHVGAI